MSLKFSSMEKTNDPRETLCPGIEYHFAHSFEGLFDVWINEERKNYKILCFAEDGDFEGYQKPRMWSQYGGNHKGCCLVINKEIFENELEKLRCHVHKKAIEYVEKDIIDKNLEQLPNEDLDSYFERNIEYFCFTKHSDWKNEKEYRYVIKNSDDVFVPISKALSEVFISYKMPKIMLEKIIEILCPEIIVKLIHWENGFARISKTYSSYEDYLLEELEPVLSTIFKVHVFMDSCYWELTLSELIEKYNKDACHINEIETLVSKILSEYESLKNSKSITGLLSARKNWLKEVEDYEDSIQY